MSVRTRRIGTEIRRIISDILDSGEIHDPRFSGLISITDAVVAKDLKTANVFFSCYGDEEQIQNTEKAFLSASKFIQSKVGERLGIKFTPILNFVRDESIAYGARIEKLLDSIEVDDEL